MGAIQSSFNQLIATVAGGIALGQHVSEQKWANKKVAIDEAEKYNTAMGDINKETEALNVQQEGINAQTGKIDKNVENLYERVGQKESLTPQEKGLVTRYDNAYKRLEEEQTMVTKRREELNERIDMLKNKRQFVERSQKKAGFKDIPIKEAIEAKKPNETLDEMKNARKEGRL